MIKTIRYYNGILLAIFKSCHRTRYTYTQNANGSHFVIKCTLEKVNPNCFICIPRELTLTPGNLGPLSRESSVQIRVPLVQRQLLTLPEQMNSPTSVAGAAYPSRTDEFTHRVRVAQSVVFSVMFCRSLFVLFRCSLYCLSFRDLRFLITPLASSNFVQPFVVVAWMRLHIFEIKIVLLTCHSPNIFSCNGPRSGFPLYNLTTPIDKPVSILCLRTSWQLFGLSRENRQQYCVCLYFNVGLLGCHNDQILRYSTHFTLISNVFVEFNKNAHRPALFYIFQENLRVTL